MRLNDFVKRLSNSFILNERGGALAELAIIVPLLIVLLAAVSEFGRYFQRYTTLSKATRTAARYLSSHPYNTAEIDKAKNLVVCGRLSCTCTGQPQPCTGGDELVPGMTFSKVCIETTGSPQIETVTVRIPHVSGGCGAPYVYQPVFNIGALLHTNFTMAIPVNPSTTMYYIAN